MSHAVNCTDVRRTIDNDVAGKPTCECCRDSAVAHMRTCWYCGEWLASMLVCVDERSYREGRMAKAEFLAAMKTIRRRQRKQRCR
jgi:hypothetical protein